MSAGRTQARLCAPALLVVLLLTGCGSDDGTSSVAVPASPTAPTVSPTAEPAPTAGQSSSEPAAQTEARAAYWLGAAQDPRGPRLYREFEQRPVGDPAQAVEDAVDLMLAGEPNDPDYTSLWAFGTELRSIERDGTTAVVDLSQEATTNGGGSAFEAMTLQQLVHTVTAADPSLTGVRLLVEGQPVETLWGSVGTVQVLTRAPAAETLGPVWLDVQEGSTLGERTFGGTATVFEATVNWQLMQGGTVVDEGFSTATIGAPERGEWEGSTDAPAGDYELWAFESSARDGSITWLDTKAVTIS